MEPLRGPLEDVIGLAGIWFDTTEQHLLEARALECQACMKVQRRLPDQREMVTWSKGQ